MKYNKQHIKQQQFGNIIDSQKKPYLKTACGKISMSCTYFRHDSLLQRHIYDIRCLFQARHNSSFQGHIYDVRCLFQALSPCIWYLPVAFLIFSHWPVYCLVSDVYNFLIWAQNKELLHYQPSATNNWTCFANLQCGIRVQWDTSNTLALQRFEILDRLFSS